jgi:uncharacterized protein (DUF2267 family)
MKLKEFMVRVKDKAGMDSLPRTEKLVATVFRLLSARLTKPEERQLIAQFPKELKELWEMSSEKEADSFKFNKSDFIEKVKADGRLSCDEEAEKVIRAVFNAIKAQVSSGESNDVEAQLPDGLKRMWREA